MKKQYRKPELLIEEYELSVSVAASCDPLSSDIEGWIDMYKQLGYSDEQIFEELENIYGDGVLCYHTSQGTGVFYS